MEGESQSSISAISWADKLVFALLALSVVALPLVIFSANSTLATAEKRSLFLILTLGTVIVWLLARFKGQKFDLPRSSILGASFLVWLVTLFSTIFSPARTVSLWGTPLDIITLSSVTVGVALLYLSSSYFKPLSRVALFYTLLFAVSVPIFVAQVFHFGLLGSWSDVGIFFALICILSVILSEYSRQIPFLRLLGITGLVLSLIAITFVNVWLISLLLLISVFVVCILKLTTITGTLKQKFPLLAVVAMVVLAIGLIGGRSGGFLLPIINRVAPAPLSVRPSLATTAGVGWATFSQDPILGAGPNLFAREWVKYKPLEVNQTEFWGMDFTTGSGFIPTIIVETGLLGLATWALFLVALCITGFGVIKRAKSQNLLTTYALASLFGTCLLWVMQIFFVTGYALLALTFTITGVLVACRLYLQEVPERVYTTEGRPRLRSLISSILILLVLLVGWVGYATAAQHLAFKTFTSALLAGGNGDIDGAVVKIERAISLDGLDAYYRTLAELNLSALARSNVANQNDPTTLEQNFIIFYNKAMAAANKAISLDPTNYLNHLSLATVYADVVSLKVDGAYDQAKLSYETAASLNPTSPLIPLSMARLEVAHLTPKEAVPYLNAAIALKPNYAPAFLFASQISVASGDLDTAIKTSDWATQAAPSDFSAFFQLGYLRYQNEEYKLAIEALSRSLALNPSYANAKYFLGLAYYQTGKVALAIGEFEELLAPNPSNEAVTDILTNLRAGRGPFERVSTP